MGVLLLSFSLSPSSPVTQINKQNLKTRSHYKIVLFSFPWPGSDHACHKIQQFKDLWTIEKTKSSKFGHANRMQCSPSTFDQESL